MKHLLWPLLLFVLSGATGRFGRINERCVGGRSSRGLPCDSAAFFEFASATGAGMTATCACVNPTGAKGETLSFTRAGSATCRKQGFAKTGIVDGDMVTCGAGLARVELSGSIPGLHVENIANTNNVTQSAQICNAAWADVGTPSPACAADSAAGPWGTTTMDSFGDDSVAALEGRSFAVATTSLTLHSVSCYVKAGTATSATISLVGTGNASGDCSATISGLSGTTSQHITCTSAAAYAAGLTGVTLSILVGNAVGVTGTILVEQCDHFTGVRAGEVPSPIPTAGAAVTRAAEIAGFARTLATPSGFCVAGSNEIQSLGALPGSAGLVAPQLSSGGALDTSPTTPQVWSYWTGANIALDGTGSASTGSYDPGAGSISAPSVFRTISRHSGGASGNWAMCLNGTCFTQGTTSSWNAPTYTSIRLQASVGTYNNSIWTKVQFDPSPTKCQ